MKISEMGKVYQWYCPNCRWPNYADDDCVAVGISLWCEHCDRYMTVVEEAVEEECTHSTTRTETETVGLSGYCDKIYCSTCGKFLYDYYGH